MPAKLITDKENIIVVEISKATALICMGFELIDCRPVDVDEFPGVYIYTFPRNQETFTALGNFDEGKLLVEPGQYCETMVSLHDKYHIGSQS